MSLIYLHSVLPTLDFDFKPEVHSDELFILLKFNLSSQRFSKIKKLRAFYDINNLIVALCSEGIEDNRANYSGAKILELFEDNEELDMVIQEFLEKYSVDSERALHIKELYLHYYMNGIRKSEGFLKQIFTFEHNLHLVNTAFKAKRDSVDFQKTLFPEQLMTEVAESLHRSERSSEFVFPLEFNELGNLINETNGDPRLQFLAETRFRFNFYKKEIERKPLRFDGILAYLMCLWILEDIHSLDQREGVKIVNAIVENENE